MWHRCETAEDVKKLFRRIALMVHPDKGGEADIFIMLQESYEEEILRRKARSSNPKNKTTYKKKEEPKKDQPKYGGLYEAVYENVYVGDERLEMLKSIFLYAKSHPNFKTEFLLSVWDFISKHSYATSGQYNGLLKAYYSFKMYESEKG